MVLWINYLQIIKQEFHFEYQKPAFSANSMRDIKQKRNIYAPLKISENIMDMVEICF